MKTVAVNRWTSHFLYNTCRLSSVLVILHKCKRNGSDSTGLWCIQTWQPSRCLSCKPGNPPSRPLDHPRSDLLILNSFQTGQLSILSGTDIINHAITHAETRQITSAPAIDCRTHCLQENSASICFKSVLRWCDCTCVCVRDCPSWLLLTRVLKRWSLHVCRPPSSPPKKFEKLKKNVQVYVHGDDDRTRTKGPSLPFNALLLHSPI